MMKTYRRSVKGVISILGRPYSVYMTQDEFKALQNKPKGFTGA